MAYDSIATRYAQALFDTVQAEDRSSDTLEALQSLGELLHAHADLRQLLGNPDVEVEDKVGVLDRVLHHAWSDTVRAFFRMVVSMGRAESLPQIIEAFQAAVDEAEGRLRVTVRTARPLPEAALKRLKTTLEHRERKHVEIHTEVAPSLLGGVQVFLGHRVIDGSVQRQLLELRERLSTVRVH